MEENQIRDTQIRDNRTLLGLFAIALAIYLGLTSQPNNIVNVSAKTELDSCVEISEELLGDRRKALEYCWLSVPK
ncbi:hypothetical protein N8994_01220 [Gammaproteobacteria bacterium]|nr:hypothetical protein [Gammaproteobacteria bacterium]